MRSVAPLWCVQWHCSGSPQPGRGSRARLQCSSGHRSHQQTHTTWAKRGARTLKVGVEPWSQVEDLLAIPEQLLVFQSSWPLEGAAATGTSSLAERRSLPWVAADSQAGGCTQRGCRHWIFAEWEPGPKSLILGVGEAAGGGWEAAGVRSSSVHRAAPVLLAQELGGGVLHHAQPPSGGSQRQQAADEGGWQPAH